ncbi:MAG: hypothetical protein EBU49_08510 [Proteobacteria bacterium]|nr:hypothetical protein [Pseudomonadota bacterium]
MSELLDELRVQGKRIYATTLRALARDREATGTERSQAWLAVEEAAHDQLRRWDYFSHPELQAK